MINAIANHIYNIIIISIAFTIYFKTTKITKISNHKGIKLFHNSFLFFAIAFSLNYLITLINLQIDKFAILLFFQSFVYNYVLTIAGLYLISSLFWKGQEQTISKLHLIATIVAFISMFNENLFFTTQIIIYSYGIITAYSNYKEKKTKFSEFYLFGIFFLLINNLFYLISNTTPFLKLSTIPQLLTIITFSIILYGVNKIIK